MTDGTTQIRPWVFFLCTGLLLIAGGVVIASRVSASKSEMRELKNWKGGADKAWKSVRADARKARTASKQALTKVGELEESAAKEIARKLGSVKSEREGRVKPLEGKLGKLEAKLDRQADAIRVLKDQLAALEKVGDKLQTQQGNFAANLQSSVQGLLPKGAILPWMPTEEGEDVPEGWVLCDGDNDTPDLRGRFLRGVGSAEEAGKRSQTGDGAEIVLNHLESVEKLDDSGWQSPRIGKAPGKGDAGWWSYWSRDKLVGEEIASALPHFTVLYIMKTE